MDATAQKLPYLTNLTLDFSDNHLVMKNDSAKNRKKNRIRPYQKNKKREHDLDQEEKTKKSKKDINSNRENKKDIPELKVGIKRKVLIIS